VKIGKIGAVHLRIAIGGISQRCSHVVCYHSDEKKSHSISAAEYNSQWKASDSEILLKYAQYWFGGPGPRLWSKWWEGDDAGGQRRRHGVYILLFTFGALGIWKLMKTPYGAPNHRTRTLLNCRAVTCVGIPKISVYFSGGPSREVEANRRKQGRRGEITSTIARYNVHVINVRKNNGNTRQGWPEKR
jgi:hypothetical protein